MSDQPGPRFFVPHADDEEQAERVYGAVREWIANLAFPPADDRICSVTYRHNGKTHTATVGQRDDLAGEEVIAIFRPASASGAYMICTPTRGVARGGPVLAGDILALVRFASAAE